MGTIILIINKASTRQDVKKQKSIITEYLGKRLLDKEQPDENTPAVLVIDSLSCEDKKKITDFFNNENTIIVFIEGEESAANMPYLDCLIMKNT